MHVCQAQSAHGRKGKDYKLAKNAMKNVLTGEAMSLFGNSFAAHEWKSAGAVRHDRAGAFRVLTPRPSGAIRYPNIVSIRRYPRYLTPKLIAR